MSPIDEVTLNFNPQSLLILNVVLGIVMFGIALDMKLNDFRSIFSLPRSMLVGLGSQFLLLPAFTFLLTRILDPLPSIALGMILVAACPGGNMSNFFTYLAKGNTALSVSMSAIATIFAMFMTPLNVSFWGSLNPGTNAILTAISLNPLDMVVTIFLLLGLPLTIGLFISHRFPAWANKAKTPFKYFSVIAFVSFVLIALAGNWQYFLAYVGAVMFVVLIQNATALLTGYTGATLFGLPEKDRRAVSIEVGIQNSGLGLILIFNFFNGLGGMAIVAAWWGIWHIISGMTIATFWSRRPTVSGNQLEPDHSTS